MSTCETCVHWEGLSYSGDHARGDYEKPEPGEWGRCILIGEREVGSGRRAEKPTTPRAFTRDGSDYWSSLVTRSDFGCIEHTPASDQYDRDPACVARWPECEEGAFDPRCCRFPKSCSPFPPDQETPHQ